MKMETINLDSVDKYNKLFGLPTLHPLAAVVDLKQSTKRLGQARMTYGLYALFLEKRVALHSQVWAQAI